MLLRDIVEAVFGVVLPADTPLPDDAEDTGTHGGEGDAYGAKSPDNASYPVYLYDFS